MFPNVISKIHFSEKPILKLDVEKNRHFLLPTDELEIAKN